jgi:hypothetical protein
MSHDERKALMAALAAAFDPSEVKFKPGAVSGNRALALAYVDTRTVQDRLDEVLGIDGWQDTYTPLPDGSVVCELRCRIGGEWIVKTDVGGASEQPDAGDRIKAAFSDALKRAAVKFGIGRYLYRLPSSWCDWDPAKKRFLKTPQLPQEATAAGKTALKSAAAGPTPLDAAGNGITAKQWAALEALCKAKGFKAADVLAHFHVAKPRDIPAGQFAEAAALIEKTSKI